MYDYMHRASDDQVLAISTSIAARNNENAALLLNGHEMSRST